MAIYGIATNQAPVKASELEAMRAGFGHNAQAKNAHALPCFGMGIAATNESSTFWSSEQIVVACDAELCAGQESKEITAAEGIANLYLAHGPSFVSRLRGAFALAIWDRSERKLLLAVDRFGMKRLCYAEHDSEIAFATQPSAIFATGRFTKNVDLSAITEFLVYNTVPIPRTAFEGVSRVAPGQLVAWTEKGTSKTLYWDMQYPETDRRPAHVLSEEMLARLEDAVRVTAQGLDPSRTGCFLSGGTDSSSIVGLLTQISAPPAHAFSIGFSEERFNELEYARLAAKHFGAQHVEGRLGPEEAHGVAEKILSTYEEPFGNSSAIPTYWCAKLAREHGMDVLLAGDGGDELFGGNERYREEQIFSFYYRIPAGARRNVVEPIVLASSAKTGPLRKLRNYVDLCNMGNPERYCRWRLLKKFSPELVLEDTMPFRNGHSDLLAAMRQHYRSAPARTELNRLLYVDVKMTLGDDDLPKVTQTAELAGVRVRFPYLDHELAEFSGRVPASLKVRGLEKRFLFKRATEKLLPKAILNKKKHGFGLPIGFWLKSNPKWHAWAQDVLYDSRTYQRGYFRRSFIEHLFSNMEHDETPYFGDLLWVFLVLELWHRQHVEVAACCA